MFAHLEPEERGCAVRRRVAGRRGGRAKNWRCVWTLIRTAALAS